MEKSCNKKCNISNERMRAIYFDTSGYSQEELMQARSLERNLMQLDNLASDFRYCAQLYLFCFEQRELTRDMRDTNGLSDLIMFNNVTQWFQIAGRNGAILCCSFARIMDEINSNNLKYVREKVDMTERKKGSKLFMEHFKEVKKVRNSAAHPGEYIKTSEGFEKHAHQNVYVANMMSAGADSLSYGSTVDGDLVRYILSEQKADVLDQVTSHYFRAFYPLQHPNMTLSVEWYQELEAKRLVDQSTRPPWWRRLRIIGSQ